MRAAGSHPFAIVAWWVVLASIPVMSYTGRNLQAWLHGSFGKTTLEWLMGGLALGVAVAGGWFVARRAGRRQLVHLLWLLPLYGGLIASLPIVEERLHVVLFGAYGFFTLLAYRGLRAAVLLLALPFLDEGFQGLLPDRVGDWRDVAVNLAGAGLGAAVAWIAGSTRE